MQLSKEKQNKEIQSRKYMSSSSYVPTLLKASQ